MCDTMNTSAAPVMNIPGRASQPTSRRRRQGSGISGKTAMSLRRFGRGFLPKSHFDLPFPLSYLDGKRLKEVTGQLKRDVLDVEVEVVCKRRV